MAVSARLAGLRADPVDLYGQLVQPGLEAADARVRSRVSGPTNRTGALRVILSQIG